VIKKPFAGQNPLTICDFKIGPISEGAVLIGKIKKKNNVTIETDFYGPTILKTEFANISKSY
jgi:hypothetical protein